MVKKRNRRKKGLKGFFGLILGLAALIALAAFLLSAYFLIVGFVENNILTVFIVSGLGLILFWFLGKITFSKVGGGLLNRF